jgi:hypothetical protein
MRPNPNWDSLDVVEFVMALEEKGIELDMEIEDLPEPRSPEAVLLLEIACPPYEARWRAPEPKDAWPSAVRVFGERERTVLFRDRCQ